MDESAVARYFDASADTYSRPSEIEGSRSWPIVDGFVADRCEPGNRIFEIGCGDGLLLEYTLEHTDVGEAYGIDISGEMLPDATEDVRGRYLQASATDLPLPFQPESFDFVVLCDVLHHLVGETRAHSKRKAQAALVEAASLLEPGGYLILKDIYYRSPIGPDSLSSHLIFYGLKELGGLASKIDEQAAPGLLVSFYTRAELQELLEQAGTTVLREEIEPKTADTIPRRVLVGESACIRLYARRNRRGRKLVEG